MEQASTDTTTKSQRSQFVDGIVEGSIVSLELLKTVADAISLPYLSFSSQILLSILNAVSRSRENTEILTRLAERAVQVVATIEAQLKDTDPSPRIQRHVATLEDVLKSVEKRVKREGQRPLIFRVALSQRVRSQVTALEQRLQDALSMFQITTLLSIHDISESLIASAKEQSVTLRRIEAKITTICEVNDAGESSSSSIKIIRDEDLDPLEEFYIDSNYQIQSANVGNRMLITKVFHGRRAKQHWKATIDFSHRMLHPNLLHMKGISSAESPMPFVVFGASCEGTVETRIASTLVEDLSRSTQLGLKIVGGLSSGLNFLNMQGIPLASISVKNFEVFITVDDVVVIGINPVGLTGLFLPDSGIVEDEDSKEEALWRIFNELCLKTFEDANYILYQEQLEREHALPEEQDVRQLPQHGTAESEMRFPPTRPPPKRTNSIDEKTNVPPRRELVWMTPPQRGLTTLAVVAQHYKRALVLPRSGNILLLRQLSARRSARSRHRCKGYRKEEITLTTTIQRSAIISHFTPLPRERCTVCGQEVEDAGIFNCVCGATEDDGISPTIKCSVCDTWQHLACVDVPPQGRLYFSCNACLGVHSSTGTQPGSIIYTTTVNPEGQTVYHPFKAVPASYQSATGTILGIQWVPEETTLVVPLGAEPATADFTAAFRGDNIPGVVESSSSSSKFKAIALYSYKASADNPADLSFSEGEVLDIVDNAGIWWRARTADGTTGIVPSNYLLPDPTEALGATASSSRFKTIAQYSYKASADHPTELSFSEGEELDIVDDSGKWWHARTAGGSTGIVPSNYMIDPTKTLVKAHAIQAYTADPNDEQELSFSKGEELDILDDRGKWWWARKDDGSTGMVPSELMQNLDLS